MNFNDYNTRDLLWLGDFSPRWIALLVIMGLLVLAVSAYDLRTLKAYRRWTLVGLRTAVYGLAVLLLLEPAIDLKHVSKVKNHVAVLVDTSRSMTLKVNDQGDTRYGRVVEALAQLKPLLENDNDDHHFTLFSYGDGLQSASLAALSGLEPGADRADLTGALEAVGEHFEGSDLGGVVVLSDGIDTGAIGRRVRRGEPLDDVTLASLRRLGAPINTLAAASAEGLRDVAIARVLHDDFAFVHNSISVDVEIQAIGMDQTSFPVSLRRDSELLQTRTVQLRPGTTRHMVKFEFVPKRIGKEIYTVQVPEFAGEALYENNTQHFVLKVIRDKVRVLQVVGRPSWDQRYLRQMLKRNPNVDLVSFFILRTNANPQVVAPHEMSLIPFPTDELFRDELGSFDLVIFQNFNFGPYQMGQYLSSIADFVNEGGGFAMVGGDLSFASGGYARTPVEGILPVKLPASGPRQNLIDTAAFNPKLTAAGHRHPITQLAFDPSANQEIWGELPAMRGTNIVLGPTEGATVLATHPRLRNGAEAMPVITVAEQGKGRAMALTVDSTWRWAFSNAGQGGTAREYQMFWNNAMRWLIRDPELKLVRLEVPEDIYPPGTRLEATVRVFAPDYTPARDAKGTVRILYRSLEQQGKDGGGAELVETIEFTTDHAGHFALNYPVAKSGIYEVQVEAKTASGTLSDEEIFLSVPAVDQFRDIIPRNELLAAMAAATEGHHAVLPSFSNASLAFNPPRYVQVNHRRVIQLWDSFLIFAVLVGLLAVEWSLRRRWGRL
ncbi:MAG: hypothetical protein H0U74_23415 [Bradymonadaceae bacterium]|nr:hypothetical protein [Lujinxingiaceae bacterium]